MAGASGTSDTPGAAAPEERVRITLTPELASVPQARRAAVSVLESWGLDALVADAQLVVSELVTNAVLHAGTAIELIVWRRGTRVRIEVIDGSPLLPVSRRHRTDAGTGRGLVLVARLSTDWAVTSTARGKVVWAELAASADAMRADVMDDDLTAEIADLLAAAVDMGADVDIAGSPSSSSSSSPSADDEAGAGRLAQDRRASLVPA